jgi:ribosomal protein L35
MPKQKTRKALIKKIKITKKRKVLRRSTSQNHYNSKDTGSEGRKKRKDVRLFRSDEKNILKAVYNV